MPEKLVTSGGTAKSTKPSTGIKVLGGVPASGLKGSFSFALASLLNAFSYLAFAFSTLPFFSSFFPDVFQIFFQIVSRLCLNCAQTAPRRAVARAIARVTGEAYRLTRLIRHSLACCQTPPISQTLPFMLLSLSPDSPDALLRVSRLFHIHRHSQGA